MSANKYNITCEICKEPATVRAPHHKTCGKSECKDTYRQRRRRELEAARARKRRAKAKGLKPAKRKEERTCPNCEIIFLVWPGQNQVYCTAACRSEHEAERLEREEAERMLEYMKGPAPIDTMWLTIEPALIYQEKGYNVTSMSTIFNPWGMCA